MTEHMTYHELRLARKKLGLTQKQMAAKLGLSMPGYTKIEYGVRNIREALAARIREMVDENNLK